jgi:hypothetical protein
VGCKYDNEFESLVNLRLKMSETFARVAQRYDNEFESLVNLKLKMSETFARVAQR